MVIIFGNSILQYLVFCHWLFCLADGNNRRRHNISDYNQTLLQTKITLIDVMTLKGKSNHYYVKDLRNPIQDYAIEQTTDIEKPLSPNEFVTKNIEKR